MAYLGWCKVLTASEDAALPLYERAIRLSPRDPSVSVWYRQIGRMHLLQSRIEEAILWFEKARSTAPTLSLTYASLASAYALDGQTERAVAVAEARRLSADGRYTSIARLKAAAGLNGGLPKIRALHEATFFAGLRKAGVPEE